MTGPEMASQVPTISRTWAPDWLRTPGRPTIVDGWELPQSLGHLPDMQGLRVLSRQL